MKKISNKTKKSIVAPLIAVAYVFVSTFCVCGPVCCDELETSVEEALVRDKRVPSPKLYTYNTESPSVHTFATTEETKITEKEKELDNETTEDIYEDVLEEEIVEEEIVEEEIIEELEEEYNENYNDEMTSIGTYHITGYVATGNPTASGDMPYVGGVAMPGIEFGTQIYIDGLGYYTVNDTGCAYGTVDVFCYSEDECYNLTSNREVYIVN